MAVVYWAHLPDQSIKTEGYVGITSNFKQRIQTHKSRAKHNYGSCYIVEKAINKYQDELVYDVIFEGDIECCALIEEELRPTELIGWNIAIGGGSLPMLGRHHTEEAKDKIHKARLGKGNGMFGKTTSPLQKQAASEYNLGRIRTEAEKQKVSIARKGVYVRGKNSTAKKVECINTGQVFDCAIDASEWCGLKTSASICKFCREGGMEYAGKHPDTKEKLVWRYIQKYDLQIS